ncbi:MAG: hypothetical protein P1U56_17190 [Saprospiraceae bacterium]|nr:hypothetical protein [Saprospiraceae bacterium]
MTRYSYVPKVNKVDFYTFETIGGKIPQLVAESNHTFTPNSLSLLEITSIIRRRKLCELLLSIEFTIDSYGLINYYCDASPDELVRFQHLQLLLNEYNDKEAIEFIQNTMDFYKKHEKELEFIRTGQTVNENLYEELEAKIDFVNPLYNSTVKLDAEIRKQPDDFCFDENGESIDPNYTGVLHKKHTDGTIEIEYHIKNGHVNGECMEYYPDGKHKKLVLFEHGNQRKVLKRWNAQGELLGGN